MTHMLLLVWISIRRRIVPCQSSLAPSLYDYHSCLFLSVSAKTDYTGGAISGIIRAGNTEAEVVFTITDDDIEEVNAEEFDIFLTLVDPPAGVLTGTDQGTVTIIDDDGELLINVFSMHHWHKGTIMVYIFYEFFDPRLIFNHLQML